MEYYDWKVIILAQTVLYIDCMDDENLHFFFEWKPGSGTLARSSPLFEFGGDYDSI
jgi:DNA gyrase inhibitor GyrI